MEDLSKMKSDAKILIIIPARSGSKGLRDKNKKIFNGNPLCSITFEFASNLSKFYESSVVVSTNDPEIQKLSESFFEKSGYERSEALSGDDTKMNDTIMDVINWANSRIVFDWVLLLQVTTPQRELAPIMDFINWALEEGDSSCYATCSPTGQKAYELLKRDNNELKPLSKRVNSPLRQENSNDEIFFEDGCGYFASKRFITKNDEFIISEGLKYFPCHKNRIIDIDNRIDFELAEALCKRNEG